MKLRHQSIHFRADWSGDEAHFRRTRRPHTYFFEECTPFWCGHRNVSKRFNTALLFKKWFDRTYPISRSRGNAAQRLYWRTHKEEWKLQNAASR